MTHWHQWIFLVTSYKPKVNSGEISFISLRYWNLNTIYNFWTINNILEMVSLFLLYNQEIRVWSVNSLFKGLMVSDSLHVATQVQTLSHHAMLLIPGNPWAHLIHMGPSTHPASKLEAVQGEKGLLPPNPMNGPGVSHSSRKSRALWAGERKACFLSWC